MPLCVSSTISNVSVRFESVTVYACDPHALVLDDDVKVNDVAPLCGANVAIVPLQPLPLVCALAAASVNVPVYPGSLTAIVAVSLGPVKPSVAGVGSGL